MFAKSLKAAAAGALLVAALTAPAVAQKTKLTVYTALENDQLGAVQGRDREGGADVEVEWVRDSTGVITARFLAEKDNPKADIVLGLAASSLLLFKKAGLLEAYQPKGAEALKPAFRSSDGSWTGQDAFLGVICYNTVEGQKAGLAPPKSWKDLTDAKYKDKLVMPHPASSGTGYLTVAAWMQLMGEAEAWKFMDALHQNIAVYTHSGSAPCVQAAKGERVAGIAFDMRAAREKTNGAPIEIISPVGGHRLGHGGLRHRQGHQEARRRQEGRRLGREQGRQRALLEVLRDRRPPRGQEPAEELSGRRRGAHGQDRLRRRWRTTATRMLAEWSKRYESKAAPKN